MSKLMTIQKDQQKKFSSAEAKKPSNHLWLISFFFPTESCASKAVSYGAVPLLLQMFCDWQRTDHHHRQTNIRKAILNVIKNITMSSMLTHYSPTCEYIFSILFSSFHLLLTRRICLAIKNILRGVFIPHILITLMFYPVGIMYGEIRCQVVLWVKGFIEETTDYIV